MSFSAEELQGLGADRFRSFVILVLQDELPQKVLDDYREHARIVEHPVLQQTPDYFKYDIYFEIVCYGAFCLSIASVPHMTKWRLFFTTFDRSRWASFETGVSDTLCSEMSMLDMRFPDQSHEERHPLPELAKLAFIQYHARFTDSDPHVDLLARLRAARSDEDLGCVHFSERMSQAIDPAFGAPYGTFRRHWVPLGRHIFDMAKQRVEVELEDKRVRLMRILRESDTGC